MKFFAIFSLLLCLCSFCDTFLITSPLVVDAVSSQYCRITEESTLIYKSANISDDLSNIYFELTSTYFAQILGTENEFYKVNYDGITGYVLKDEVTIVYGTPTTPFPEDITFQINASASAVIRSIPSVEGNYLGLLPCNTTLSYFGKVEGTEAISGLGKYWFFVTYTSFEQGVISGYVYAPLTENLTEIPPNMEELSTIPVGGSVDDILSPELLNINNLLLIAGLSIGALVLLLLLIAPMRKNKKERLKLPQQQLPYEQQKKKVDNDNFDF